MNLVFVHFPVYRYGVPQSIKEEFELKLHVPARKSITASQSIKEEVHPILDNPAAHAKNKDMRRAIHLPILQKLDSIDRKLDKLGKLDDIARTLNEIRDVLGVSAQGEARESLILFLELEKEEIPLKIKEATRRNPHMPDVVVETETTVYLVEAKHTIHSSREAEKVVEQLSRGAVWYQKNWKKHGFTKKGPVVPVAFAWELPQTAREVLLQNGVWVLYGGKLHKPRGKRAGIQGKKKSVST